MSGNTMPDAPKPDLLEEALTAGNTKITEKPNSQSSTDGVSSDTINLEMGTEVTEETFGVGANKRVLLVTKGISLKNLVAAAK